MERPLATLDDVTFGYQRSLPIMTRFSAQFESQKAYAVTGPSGCGKSTLLFLLGLLLRPQSGDVTLLGTRCTGATDQQRSSIRRHQIGFVFQDALLETSMTVWQNLREALPRTTPASQARDRAAAMLDALALNGDMLDRPCIALSGGQAQRIATVRALLKQPAIVLADEPTGNLDDRSAELVLDALLSYGRLPGQTCIVVTHDQRIVDRVDAHVRVG